MSLERLNLASEPFLNRRPVRRFAVVVWLVGGALLVLNLWLVARYRTDSTELRSRLAAVRSEIDESSREIASVAGRLDELGSSQLNQEVLFFNSRIAERTFAWSELLELMGDTLPGGVRLTSLTPSRRGARDRRSEEGAGIELQIAGVAKGDTELYTWIDSLYADPAFDRPRLDNEASDGSQVTFRLDVLYRPSAASDRAGSGGAGAAGGAR